MILYMLRRFFVLSLAAVGIVIAQAPEGRSSFQTRCAVCHGTDGNGGEHAPSILARIARTSEPDLTALLKEGIPARGMPSFNDMPEAEMRSLVAFLRAMTPAGGGRGGRGAPARVKVELTPGKTLEGVAIGRTAREMQLRSD